MAAVVTTVAVAAIPASASAVAFGKRTLKQGMSGSDVKTAQKLLRKTGERITADGQFGPATKLAVRRFEGTEGLKENGKIERTEAPTLKQAADDAAAQRAAERQTAASEADPAAGGTATTPTDPATAAPTDPATDTGGAATTMGGATPTTPVGVPGEKAILNADGTATAPASAPPAVQAIIAAGNEIATKPYRYGGGHTLKWKDSGYDCSGSVSYALHGAGLLDSPMPSGNFETWGESGPGQWVTIYTRADHMYMYVAGLRFDTSGAHPSRWQDAKRSNRGFVVRHPTGL